MNTIYLLWDWGDGFENEYPEIVGYITAKDAADAEADRRSREYHKTVEARHNARMRNTEGLPFDEQDPRYFVTEVAPLTASSADEQAI